MFAKDLKVGDKVIVTQPIISRGSSGGRAGKENRSGSIYAITDRMIVVQHDRGDKECYTAGDLITGHVKISVVPDDEKAVR